ncbi:MAG: hypothetical protein ABI591_22675 [Kofleriaceae bacterium]
MRSSLVVALVLVAGTAAADPAIVLGPSDTAPTDAPVHVSRASGSGMWLDFGAGVARVSPGNGGVYDGQFVRFAPQATLNRHLYIGGELDVGSFDGDAVAHDSSAARGAAGAAMAPDGITGSMSALKAVIGARAMAGSISGAVELAGGIEFTEVTNASMVSNEAHRGVIEAHGRLDLWLSPVVSVGGLVGADLTEKDNLTAAVQLSFHFGSFERTR